MAPVLDELEKKYSGKLVIERVNTREDPQKAQDLGVRMIPTQIFFAPDSKELYRHVGFYAGADIAAKWAELGYKLEEGG
jgi:thioredoxin 1